MRKNKFLYFLKNLFYKKNKFQVTPYKLGKPNLPMCGNCGSHLKFPEKMKLIEDETYHLSKLRLSIKKKGKMHKGVQVLPQIIHFEHLVDERKHEYYCRNCLSSFENCLIIKVVDNLVMVFI